MKEFELPEIWYLKANVDDHEIINNYRINIAKYNDTQFYFNDYNIMFKDGSGGDLDTVSENIVPITMDQFKKYVLNIEEENVLKEPEDLSYLIDLFKTLQ